MWWENEAHQMEVSGIHLPSKFRIVLAQVRRNFAPNRHRGFLLPDARFPAEIQTFQLGGAIPMTQESSHFGIARRSVECATPRSSL